VVGSDTSNVSGIFYYQNISKEVGQRRF